MLRVRDRVPGIAGRLLLVRRGPVILLWAGSRVPATGLLHLALLPVIGVGALGIPTAVGGLALALPVGSGRGHCAIFFATTTHDKDDADDNDDSDNKDCASDDWQSKERCEHWYYHNKFTPFKRRGGTGRQSMSGLPIATRSEINRVLVQVPLQLRL